MNVSDAADLHFLFLRAINTGSRRLTNDQLLAPLVDAGLRHVAAFQAAGNIALRSSVDERVDADEIERLLADAYGFDAAVFVRSESELRSAIERCPFTSSQLGATAGKTQVSFLRSPATSEQLAAVESITPSDDLVVFDGAEWYWLPVDGVSTSALPVPKIERILGDTTMRTLGTLERMLEKFAA